MSLDSTVQNFFVQNQPTVQFSQTGHKQIVHTSGKVDRRIETTVLIPAYNEEKALPHVLKPIFEVIDDTFEVIVVDDGSSDATKEVAATFPCRVVSLAQNSGKGAAMQTGIHCARGKNIIFIDGDATYPADMIPIMAEKLRECELVRCIRIVGRNNIPWLNRVGNQLFDRIIATVHGINGADLLTGLYGLRRQRMLDMRLESVGFDIESEIMIKSQAMRLTSCDLIIQYNQRIGEKKLNPLRDGMAILKRVLMLVLIYNPMLMYVMPGLILWLLSIIGGLLVLGDVSVVRNLGFSTNTLIVCATAFLGGFQLMAFGSIANLYAADTGLAPLNKKLSLIAIKTPRWSGMMTGILLFLIGAVLTGYSIWTWVFGGFGQFSGTNMLVLAMALIVWGIQLTSTMFFFSIFTNIARETFQASEVTYTEPDTPRLSYGMGDQQVGMA